MFNMSFSTFGITAKSIFDKNIKGFGENTRTLEIYTYYYGQENRLFNMKKMILWFLGGAFEATILYYFIYLAFNETGVTYQHEMDLDYLNMLMFSTIIIYLTTKIIYLTHVYTILQYISYSIGIFTYAIFFIIFNFADTIQMYHVIGHTWGDGTFWLYLTFCNFMLMFFLYLYYFIKDFLCPDFRRKAFLAIGKKLDADVEALSKKWVYEERNYNKFLRWLYY